MKSKPASSPTAYDWLGVHAKAPSELISASYWLAAGALQLRRGAGERIDETLFALTRAYETVADPVRRAQYDVAVGHDYEPLTRRSLPKVRRTLRGRIFGRPMDYGAFDFYEVMGVSPDAPQQMLPEAWHIMRDHYLRLPPQSKNRKNLLEALDAAYKVLNSPESRSRYDAKMRTAAPILDGNLIAPPASPLKDPRQGEEELATATGQEAVSTVISPVDADAELTIDSDAHPTVFTNPEPATHEDHKSSTFDATYQTQAEQVRPSPQQERSPERAVSRSAQPPPDLRAPAGPTTSTTTTSGDGEEDPRRPMGERLAAFAAGSTRALGQVAATTGRFVGRGLQGVWRRGRGSWTNSRETQSQNRTPRSAPPIQPPIAAGARFTRVPQAQVEQALLSRLAKYMEDSQPEIAKAEDREPEDD